jgi:hypothetical protein
MLSDLTNIPRIMRGKAWLNGARLLDIWFSRSHAIAPNYSSPEESTIKMDSWVLRFQRAREVYAQLVRDRIWANQAAQQRLANLLRQQGLLGSASRSFGALNSSVPLQDRSYVNFRAIPEGSDFDDMTAALGAFVLRVVVAGTVAPQRAVGGAAPSAFDVEISEVGVYVRDSFDFEGDQYLGCWSDNPDGFLPLMPPEPGMGMGFAPFRPPVFSPVGNRDFREWRRRTGRGGDFLVFSDLKRLPLSPPDRFVIR